MQRLKYNVLAFTLSVAVGAVAHAEAPPPGDDTFSLGTVEIIGHRIAADSAVTTEAVSAEVLAERHRDDLSEALDLIPGAAIQNTGQRRERTIEIRGFNSRQIPLFIDGVPVYVPYDGNVDLARFGVDYISQVIVSKGLASLLYGPNTLGGAVNIVSRKPTEAFEASGRAEIEANNRFDTDSNRVDAYLGGTNGTVYAQVTGSYGTSNGYLLPDDFVPTAAQPAGERLNASDRDTLMTAKLGWQDENNEIAASYYRQVGSKYDPPYAGQYVRTNARPDGVTPRYWMWPYWMKESIYLVGRDSITSQGTLRWRVFNDTFRNSLSSYDDGTFTTHTRPYAFYGSVYNDYSYGGNADFEWNWNDQHTTRIASHFKRDVHREFQALPAIPVMHLDIPTYDVAIEHEWRVWSGFSLTPSYSYMWQPEHVVHVYNTNVKSYSPVTTDRSTANSGQLVATYQVLEGTSVFAGVAEKTRFPTIKERFSGGLGSAVPNPGLKPESALHAEIGAEQKGSNWSARLALFQSRLHDAVQQVSLAPTACTAPPCTQYQNVGKQRNRGFELTGSYAPLDTLHLSGEVDVVQIEYLNNPALKPIGIPGNKYRLMGDWNFLPMLFARADWQHEAARYSNPVARVAGSFNLVNAFLRFEPSSHFGTEIGVRNATNELYAYEEGFFEPGRTWLAQVDFRL